MRDIELVSLEDVPRRVENVKRSLEYIYGVELTVEFEEVPLERLYPTEDFLEKDKLTLVFMKVMTEGYDVPIIVVKHLEDYFILDGHHRSFVSKKIMRKTIGAYVLRFPEHKGYRSRPKRPLETLPIRDVGEIDDEVLRTWGQILTLLKYYETLYNTSFWLNRVTVPLKDLVPTQPEVKKKQIDSIRELLVPIVCIKSQDRFYILDGHARSLRAKQLKMKSIQAILLSSKEKIDFGIVKTAEELNLRSLKDVKISDNLTPIGTCADI